MSRRPLAPDLWEQALINGRIVHPSSDEQAASYASDWYQRQGGLFAPVLTGPAAPEPEVSESAPAAEESEHGHGRRRTRARQEKGRIQGEDLAASDKDEPYVEG